jgi:hypothetical protein
MSVRRPPRRAGRTLAGIGVLAAILAACTSASSDPPSSAASSAPVAGASGTPAAAQVTAAAGLTGTNLDAPAALPMPDRMVFNRIQYPDERREAVHDTGTLRLGNSAGRGIKVTELAVTGPYQLVSAPKLPATIAPGKHLDLKVRFTARTGAARGSVKTGTLKITTNAPGDEPSPTITLSGWWQRVSEHGEEPSVRRMTALFGLHVALPASIYSNGAVRKFSADEVLSPYWRRRDPAVPATIEEIAVWFRYGRANHVTWFAPGSTAAQPWSSSAANQDQTLLPHAGSTGNAPSTGDIEPAGAFGFTVDKQSSDPARNSAKADLAHGCGAPQCGQHVRAFQLHAADGSVLKGTYLIMEDDATSKVTWDYNDHLYLVSNVQPAAG